MTTKDTQGETIAVGECPKCGFVTGDTVRLGFPCPPTCERCGSELERATTAAKSEVMKRAE